MNVAIGVVVGSLSNPWAICVAEGELREVKSSTNRRGRYPLHEPHFVIRYLEKWPPGTSLPKFTERLREIHEKLAERSETGWVQMRVDVTGKGPTVAQGFQSNIRDCFPTSVYFNHGDKRSPEQGDSQINLGKAYLVGRLQALLQTHRVHLPKSQEAKILSEELLAYEVEMEPDASSREGAFKVGTRDELVTALGLAILDDPVLWGIRVIDL
jgi:hypothetical protein